MKSKCPFKISSESEIGERVRIFRERRLINRTNFGLSLKISCERLTSYERGRSRLPFGVFSRIFEHHKINPVWLATGDGNDSFPLDYPINLHPHPPSHWPFSRVFTDQLAEHFSPENVGEYFCPIFITSWRETLKVLRKSGVATKQQIDELKQMLTEFESITKNNPLIIG